MKDFHKAPPLLHRAGIYEVNIRQYTPEGSFRAFAGHLPRLRDMGVDILWLMPVFPIGKPCRKGELGSYYSISDFEKVNPEFGTAQDLRELIAEIHRSGMQVVIDWVANHAAHDHVWTLSHPDFFARDEAGNFFSPFDWTDVLQLDHGNPRQQDAMINAMLYWINEFDIDGFRADLAHLTPLSFWKRARQAADSAKPGLIWLAETEDPRYHDAFDISFTWQWMHEAERVCKGQQPVGQLLNVLQEYRTSFPETAFRMFFTSNHDENSWNGTEYEKYGDHAPLLAVFSFLYPSVPLLYSGQEIPNKERLPFFHRHSLQWPDKPLLHDFYKRLFFLRHSSPALACSNHPEQVPLLLLDETVLVFRRGTGPESIVVALNFSNEKKTVIYPEGWPEGTFEDCFTEERFNLAEGSSMNLPAAGMKVLKQERPL